MQSLISILASFVIGDLNYIMDGIKTNHNLEYFSNDSLFSPFLGNERLNWDFLPKFCSKYSIKKLSMSSLSFLLFSKYILNMILL